MDTGRGIIIGDGLIPLVEQFASKYVYNNKITIGLFNRMLAEMNEKAQELTGNKYVILCTSKLWNDIQLTLGEYLSNFRTDGTYLYSKAANKGNGGYVKVGATYDTYEMGGDCIAA